MGKGRKKRHIRILQQRVDADHAEALEEHIIRENVINAILGKLPVGMKMERANLPVSAYADLRPEIGTLEPSTLQPGDTTEIRETCDRILTRDFDLVKMPEGGGHHWVHKVTKRPLSTY